MHKSILAIMLGLISMLADARQRTTASDALQMLADFTPYLYNQYQPISEQNSAGEPLATFKGENTFGNNEQGVRHNADLSMICAFLCKYGRGQVELPKGITWEQLSQMAQRTLAYAYSTHKANRLYPCRNNQYWGSVGKNDFAWESSLWAMSVAYSAFFQWDNLSSSQKQHIYQMLKAECNYELERTIPTGYKGDTKAEENGWECDVLAVTLGLFPDDPLAPAWFQRLREFAVNSYSHASDRNDNTVIDPEYDNTTVAQLFAGQNLYDDYTLQNHNYFHTSYQNVVIQELGEAALAMKLFQKELHGKERWQTNSLMHNVGNVMNKVIYHLALSDGELAMPNGNDWSLFLYDQVTSFSTVACFLQDPDALMLEEAALEQIGWRQLTTEDGSWLLRADVGARRMGVQAHRVMMTWLMHHVLPTDNLKPTRWKQFQKKYAEAFHFPSQDVITASSAKRFSCFSWSEGLKSYCGYFAPVNELYNNIVVPFRANNTGNYFGWYEVEGTKTNAVDVNHTINFAHNNTFAISGTLAVNDNALLNHYLIFTAPDNLVLYVDITRAQKSCKVTGERGGLLAISTDPFTSENRFLNTEPGSFKTTGNQSQIQIPTPWVNIDNCVGAVVRKEKNPQSVMFKDTQNNNSVITTRLFTAYSDTIRQLSAGELLDTRIIAYYSNVHREATYQLNRATTAVEGLNNGWKGYIIPDTDGTTYAVLYNTMSSPSSHPDVEALPKLRKTDIVFIITTDNNMTKVETVTHKHNKLFNKKFNKQKESMNPKFIGRL